MGVSDSAVIITEEQLADLLIESDNAAGCLHMHGDETRLVCFHPNNFGAIQRGT